MEAMSSSTVEPADFLDLKLLPAWVKEPTEARNYEHYTGEEEGRRPRGRQHPARDKRDGGEKRRTANIDPPTDGIAVGSIQSGDGQIRRGEHPRPITRRMADCERRRLGVSIVRTKLKIAFHKIRILRSRDRRWKLRFVFYRTRRRSRM